MTPQPERGGPRPRVSTVAKVKWACWLGILALAACGVDAGGPAVSRICLATVDYRYVLPTDTFSTGGPVRPDGGPLCIELSGDQAVITSGEAVFMRLYVASGGSALQLLWPSGTRTVADVFRKDGQLYFVPREGSLRWFALPGLVMVEGAHDILYVHYDDADEWFDAEFRP